jgi:hypothetical protein
MQLYQRHHDSATFFKKYLVTVSVGFVLIHLCGSLNMAAYGNAHSCPCTDKGIHFLKHYRHNGVIQKAFHCYNKTFQNVF